MDDTLKKLEEIAEKLDDFSTRMNDEARVMEEELANRKRLGLKGDAAIKHYNEWIDRHGMGQKPKIQDFLSNSQRCVGCLIGKNTNFTMENKLWQHLIRQS